MKTILTKATGSFADHGAVGFVHLNGVFDTTACGLDYGDYKTKSTNNAIDCVTCLQYLDWAKSVAKKVKS